MDKNLYNKVMNVVKNYHGLSKDCLSLVKISFPSILPETLSSIISYEYQKRMKYKYVKTSDTINRYYNLYQDALNRGDPPGIIVQLSKDSGICPCLVAKLILQKSYVEDTSTGDGSGKLGSIVQTYIRDTNLIPDPRLAYETYLCTIYDDLYSPLVEIMKASLGQEYEIKLHRELFSLGLAFRDEEHLRTYGYDKTPDFKLDIPVALNGFIINWVESKALFANDELHEEYFRNQYGSYCNRFGPGLVIYWFGFVETIIQSRDQRLLIKDHFPTDVVHILPPKSLKEN